MSDQPASEYILGIDLGSNSLGWAIIGLIDGEPVQITRTGARVFEAGMEGDIESGREESRNLKRRQMRLQRRQTWRRARRLKKIFNLLLRFSLLPPLPASGTATNNLKLQIGKETNQHGAGPAATAGNLKSQISERRQNLLNELDKSIHASDWFKAKAASGKFPEPEQTTPYILRAAALDEKLEPHFLGRALYHLAQRRGYKSNRKAPPKKDEKPGEVEKGIGEIVEGMAQSGSRTLGEYLSRLSPSTARIRSRWTARDMYEQEFTAIWDSQAAHHPTLLTAAKKKELYHAIFYQRPLWFDPNTIGQCELEPAERRVPAYLLVAQRFRLLQTVNNLRVLPPDDVEMPLAPGHRKKLIDELETKGDRTFKQISKLLEFEEGYTFNLERGGEKRIKGNRTYSDFYKVFGERWRAMPPEECDRAVEYVHSFEKAGKLEDAAKKYFGLDDKAAGKLGKISLEADYMNLSRKAMERLVPLLEAGFPYGTLAPRYAAISAETTQKLLTLSETGVPFREACKSILGDAGTSSHEHDLLPAVERSLAEIRNPAVMRSLTELRKVVNAIVRQHGKPQEVHVELAHDLKKSKKQREAISKANEQNKKARAKAAEAIIKSDVGIKEPKPDDVRRFLLAEECHWTCPYTGKSISMQSLFGQEGQFDIEHIIPFSRSMDNSFQNLTLCYVPENRDLKGNKTPYQAYSGDSIRYEQILDRVKKFGGERTMVSAKLKRFAMNDDDLEIFLEDFRNRQLNDTAYATSLAAKYLGLLYGGVNDAGGKKRIQATSGQATSYFRNLWKLNSILNDGPTTDGGYKPKSRDDHRHHAVDAVVIGLTDAGMIKRLSDAAQRAPEVGRRRFAPLEGPWPNFTDSVRAEINKIVVSHRVSKKVSGALHEETIYSRPFPVVPVSSPAKRRSETAATEIRVRKPLASLTKPELEKIADEGVKKLVLKKLEELGGDPKKFPSPNERENLDRFPSFVTQDGRRIPIKRVRISKAVPTFALGKGRTARYVTSESNHHGEIYAEVDEHGNEGKWGGEVVLMSEAYQRLKAGKPVVQRDHGPLARFKFSLAAGEIVECDSGQGERRLLVVRSYTQLTAGSIIIGLAPVSDARPKKEMTASKAWVWKGPGTLRQLNPRKVVVSPLGESSEAYD